MDNKLLWILSIIHMMLFSYTYACSCMPAHPQEHYCSSDFVILARVNRRMQKNDTVTYKVRIRQEYKMSEKALVALKSGKLITSAYDEMCGSLGLESKETYVISGRIISLRAYISLCDMIIPRKELTKRQKKGLRLMYKLGCTCSIRHCIYSRCPRTTKACNWENHCHINEGICLKNKNQQCMWRTTQNLRKCIRDNQEKTHHLSMVRIEGLLNKRESFFSQSPLNLN